MCSFLLMSWIMSEALFVCESGAAEVRTEVHVSFATSCPFSTYVPYQEHPGSDYFGCSRCPRIWRGIAPLRRKEFRHATRTISKVRRWELWRCVPNRILAWRDYVFPDEGKSTNFSIQDSYLCGFLLHESDVFLPREGSPMLHNGFGSVQVF